MLPSQTHDDQTDDANRGWAHEVWTGEGWTGEADNVAAIALAVCLFVAALVFLTLAAGELHH